MGAQKEDGRKTEDPPPTEDGGEESRGVPKLLRGDGGHREFMGAPPPQGLRVTLDGSWVL